MVIFFCCQMYNPIQKLTNQAQEAQTSFRIPCVRCDNSFLVIIPVNKIDRTVRAMYLSPTILQRKTEIWTFGLLNHLLRHIRITNKYSNLRQFWTRINHVPGIPYWYYCVVMENLPGSPVNRDPCNKAPSCVFKNVNDVQSNHTY